MDTGSAGSLHELSASGKTKAEVFSEGISVRLGWYKAKVISARGQARGPFYVILKFPSFLLHF